MLVYVLELVQGVVGVDVGVDGGLVWIDGGLVWGDGGVGIDVVLV